MKLLEELRSLDVGDPGLWSVRVSVVLACSVFVLIAVLGLRVRVFGQLAPRMEAARANVVALQKQLEAAGKEARNARAIGEEADQAEALLKAAAVWIPSQAPELDLPVALAAGLDRSPLQAVRSWQAPMNLSAQLQHAGAELDWSGRYADLIAFLNHALDSTQLRELIELNLESTGLSDPGRLRATAGLVAYFGGVGAAELLRTMPGNTASLRAARASEYRQRLAGLPSPFGSPLDTTGDRGEMQTEGPPAAFPGRGQVRVGTRRYQIVEDGEGKFSLRTERR